MLVKKKLRKARIFPLMVCILKKQRNPLLNCQMLILTYDVKCKYLNYFSNTGID